MDKRKYQSSKGYSLIELLVVLAVFSVIAVLATQTTFLSLRGSRKSQAQIRVRENVDYAINIIERHLYNAKSIDCKAVQSDPTTINYIDRANIPGSFSCKIDDPNREGFIASESARLTSEEVYISSCTFSCEDVPGLVFAQEVRLEIAAEDKSQVGVEGSRFNNKYNFVIRNTQ